MKRLVILFGLAAALAYCSFGPSEYTGPDPIDPPADDAGPGPGDDGGGGDDGGSGDDGGPIAARAPHQRW